jgi:hypothetical protein
MTQIYGWLNSVLLKMLQKKTELLLVSTVAILQSAAMYWESILLGLLPPNKELVAIRAIEVSLFLTLIIMCSYIWFHIKYISKRPNMSKKNEIQELILNHLNESSYVSQISNDLSRENQFILYNLELLEKDKLVTCSSIQSPSPWWLTKFGRAYLYKT